MKKRRLECQRRNEADMNCAVPLVVSTTVEIIGEVETETEGLSTNIVDVVPNN